MSASVSRLRKYLSFMLLLLRLQLGRARYPFKLTFVVTKECHSRCNHCAIWKAKPRDELSLAEVESILQKYPHFRWVDFTGGEPTDRDDLPELIGLFVRYCPQLLFVHFPTNGLKPKRILGVAQLILQQRSIQLVITVSLDGPPEINDSLRGIPGDFERALETYVSLRALPAVKVYFGYTLHPENLQAFERTLKILRERIPDFSASDLHVNLGHRSPHYYEQDKELVRNVPEWISSLRAISKLRPCSWYPLHMVEAMYLRLAESYLSTGKTPMRCRSQELSLYLSEKGEIYSCSMWDSPLGNLRHHDYSVLQVLEREQAKDSLQTIQKGGCAHCWTPCEAFPTMLSQALRTPLRLVEDSLVPFGRGGRWVGFW